MATKVYSNVSGRNLCFQL